ncbi:MAG: methyltransferase [Spirochaetota bacterium]|nr:methyltransferase [Spirochaetota bacterium]
MADYYLEDGSFRDRQGRVFYLNTKVYRGLSPQAYEEWQCLSETRFFKDCGGDGKIVKTGLAELDNLSESDKNAIGYWQAYLEHEKIPYITYPYEWCFSMLKDAALLQLELLQRALEEDMILKDSTPYNIQWVGTNPVFIDISSFEKLKPGEPWIGYRQFCQLYLFPLILQAYKNVSFHPLLIGDIDGIQPDQCNNLMSFRDLFKKGVFLHVYLQAKAQSKYSNSNKNMKTLLKDAGFNKTLIKANLQRLDKTINALEWKTSSGTWVDYSETHSYQDDEDRQKKQFVRSAVETRSSWDIVWDLGANVGIYSRIASERAEVVLSMDIDHATVERLYLSLKKEDNKKIIPLVMNVASPSPGLGWRGVERKTLIDRGKPGLVLCLALIHHVVISSNIPLKDFINWLESLNAEIVIEFITKQDEMVQKLLQNKEDIYEDYEMPYFEKCLYDSFQVEKKEEVKPGKRYMYFVKKKN